MGTGRNFLGGLTSPTIMFSKNYVLFLYSTRYVLIFEMGKLGRNLCETSLHTPPTPTLI